MGPPHCPHCGFEGSASSSGNARCKRDAAWTCRCGSMSATAPVVAGLFFPRSKALGLDVDYDYSPTAWKKVVYAGEATSFLKRRDLKELAELDVSAERVRRATERIGGDRVAERDAQAAVYEALPIPERRRAPADQPMPAVACVQMDGGRLQVFDRVEPQRNDENTFWCE